MAKLFNFNFAVNVYKALVASAVKIVFLTKFYLIKFLWLMIILALIATAIFLTVPETIFKRSLKWAIKMSPRSRPSWTAARRTDWEDCAVSAGAWPPRSPCTGRKIPRFSLSCRSCRTGPYTVCLCRSSNRPADCRAWKVKDRTASWIWKEKGSD